MATTKKEHEVEYDFDNWTEEAEAEAIALIKPEVKYIVVEKNFIGRFENGTIVKAPLGLSLNDVDTLEAEYSNEIDRFRELIRVIGGEANVEMLAAQDISAVAVMASKYFDVFARIQGATVPES